MIDTLITIVVALFVTFTCAIAVRAVYITNVTARRERQTVEQGQKEQARTTIFTDDNLCVVCGKVYVPEGRWVCPLCEQKYSERSNI